MFTRTKRLLLALTVLLPMMSFAEDAAPAKSELDLAYEQAQAAAINGPSAVPLADQATLQLPEGYVFVPKKEANQLMTAMGNSSNPDRIGLIFGDGNWFVVVSFEKSGYIRDDEAKDWDVDAMYDSFVEGTDQQNQERVKRGIPEMEITGWVEKPNYNANSHQLVWSMGNKDKHAPADAPQGVNYNTYVLGREGYISLNLVTGRDEVEAQKPMAKSLLAAVNFNDGKKYADFNEATDHVAEYGIAALVAGAAAKKLGLFAMLALFLAKAWKLVAVALVVGGSFIGRLFGRKKESASNE